MLAITLVSGVEVNINPIIFHRGTVVSDFNSDYLI